MAEFRPNARPGLWLTYLIPIALLTSYNSYVPWNYVIITILSFVMSVYSTLFALKIFPSKNALFFNIVVHEKMSLKNLDMKPIIYFSIIFYLPGIYLLLLYEIGSNVFLFLLTLTAMIAFILLLPKIWNHFKKSFTYGEGVLILQSGILYGVKVLMNIAMDTHDPSTISGSLAIIAMVGLSSLLTLCSLSYLMNKINSPTLFYTIGSSCFCGISYPCLWFKLKRDPIMWLLNYILASYELLIMFSVWGILIGLALFKVATQSKKATTATRKYFHVLVVIVFTSGIFIDVDFLYFSSIVSLSIMLLLEHMRFHKIEPLATILNNAFKIFKDEKDVGDLVLTNLYLLSGVSLPLWITPDASKADRILLLSGVLSVGIGDSMASIIGSKIGKHKLFHSKKTVEGLIASFLSQIMFIKLLQIANLVHYKSNIIFIIFSIILTSFVETITTQVDNIALPLLLYILISLANLI